MANEVNANINIDIDTTAASAGLKALQSQISSFNKSIVASNASATAAQRDMLSTLTSQIGATKAFSTSMVSVESSVSRLGNAIDKNKLSMGEYFKYGVASSKNFGKVFSKEHNQIMSLAQERVKSLQTQYIAMGQAQNGVTKAMAIRPLNLFNADAAISIQRQQLFSKLLKDGSTSLINFGKNTQWAGRQLMVGFTVPLTIFGGVAGKIFMDLERQVVNFRRVYGDAMTPAGETDQMVKEIQNLGKEFTKYGIAVKDTVGLAADVAAAGAQGDDLVAATAQSTRLATLGMIDMNQAMTATIALQTAFKLSNEELAQSVDFLNAVENQTVLSLDDVSQAIPLVAPIIKGLGGDVQDLAIFLTAMREGGVSASEGANALKSGLASLINPTKAAYTQLDKVGISIDSILSRNKGDIRGIVTEFGSALGELGKFERQQTLAKVFGKYQFARLGALFENISTEGSQAQRVVDLTGQSFQQLNDLAEKELSAIEESIGMKFTGAIERAKLAIAPIGEVFLKVATPIIDFATKILEKFNELSPNIKQFITILVAGIGVVVPVVIMLIGLFANFAGNALKGVALMNNFFNKLRGGGSALQDLSNEELQAAAAASSLEGKTTSLTAALNVQRSAVAGLARAYGNYVASAKSAATNLPQGVRGAKPIGMATGGLVPGRGNKDTVPAMLTPGESVITKEATEKYAPILQAMNEGKLPGFYEGQVNILGGESINLNLSRATSEAPIQLMYDNAARLGEDISNTFEQILRDLKQAQDAAAEAGREMKLRSKDIQRIVVERNLPSSILPEGERGYKASSAGIKGTVAQGISQMPGITHEQSLLEQERTSAASRGAENSIREYYGELLDDVNLESRERTRLEKERNASIQQAQQISRAHTVDVSILDKTFAESWAPGMWSPQTQIENELSNMVASSEQTRGIYEKHLREVVTDSSQVEAIMGKINRNLALTDEELQTQAQVLRRILSSSSDMKNVSGGFPLYARATVGAAQGRSNFEPGYFGNQQSASRDATTQALITAKDDAVRAWKDQWLISSPSEAGAEIGENINEGVAQGIRRSVSKPVAAAADMANKVLRETNKAVAKATRSASRPAGPAGMSTQELTAQATAQARAERKLRGPVVRQGTLSPISFRAGEETTRVQNIGDAQSQAMQEQVNRAHREALSENIAVVDRSSREIKKLPPPLKKFGGALKNGSVKMQGALFAMDGMVFAASTMNNSMGEFAQKIMPAVFGFQALTMILPTIINPIGLVVSALAASAAAILFFKSKADEMSANVQKFSDSMISTQSTIDKIGEFYGKESLASRQSSDIIKKEAGVKSAEVEKAREFVKTDVGLAMQEGLGLALSRMGGDQASKQFSANLASMVLQGVMSPKEARAVAMTMGEALGNQQFGIDVNGELKKLMGPRNENLLKNPLQLAIEINEQNAKSVQSLSGNVEELSSQMAGFNQVTGADMALSIVPVFGMINGINKLTIGWDNWIGQVARSARGVLNPDDFEKIEESLKTIGSLAGNQMAQAYDNLSAAKARYKTVSEKAAKVDKDDEAAKKRASTQAKEAKKDLEALTQQVKDQQNAMSGAFAGAAPQARVTILEGMRESIAKQFENDPAMKLAWDMLSGQMKDVSQEVQFNINMGISSGVLNPVGIQNMMSLFENPEEATATINFMINSFGLGETNEMILGILNMKDPEIRKKAIIDLIVSTPGGLDQETRSALDPTGELSKTALDGGPNQAVVNNARKTAEQAKAAYDAALSDFQVGAPFADVLSEADFNMLQGYNDEVSRIKNSLKEFGYTEQEIADNPEYVNALEQREGFLWNLVDRYDKVYDAAYELQGLESTMVTTQQSYNKAVAANPPLSADNAARLAEQRREIQPLIQEFYRLQDAVQAGEDGIKIKIEPQGMSQEELNNLNDDLTTFGKMPKNILKLAGVETIGNPNELNKITKGYDEFDSKKPSVIKSAILKVVGGNGESAKIVKKQIQELGYSQEQFAKLPEATKINIVANIEAQIKLEGDIGVLEGFLKGAGSADAAEHYAKKIFELKNSLSSLKSMFEDLQNLGGGDTGPSVPKGDGGGSKEKSFLENLISDLNANAKLYLDAEKGLDGYMKNRGKFFGIFQKLRSKGVSEDILASLGTGPEAVKNARELLEMTDKEIKKLVSKLGKLSVGKAVEDARRAAIADEEKLKVSRKTSNLPKEMQDIILADESLTKAFATAKKGSPEYARLEKVVRRLAAAKKNLADETKTEADVQKEAIEQIDDARESILSDFERRGALFQQKFGNIERQWQPIIEANEKQIDLLQGQIDLIQEEIDAIEALNEADERRVRTLERENEMLNRQIEVIEERNSLIQRNIDFLNRESEIIGRQLESSERQNELDQRQIDSLSRQDELRNRIAESLSKELEYMSDSEQEIRDAYQERIDALDEVAKVNDYIIDQQQKQLGLSQAISEGDIYAATAAAQEMRASSAQFSAEQVRGGLESGMESEVAGLRTSGGLTREQAEQQLSTIKEQSYQISLQTRDIEDRIYERNLALLPVRERQYEIGLQIRDLEDQVYQNNLLMVPIRDQIAAKDDQIRAIQDVIYQRESDILKIQVDRLEPLDKQLQAQQKSLDNNQTSLANARAAVRIEGQTYDELQNQIDAEKEAYDVAVAMIKTGGENRKSVENIRKKWVEVTNQIAAAVRTARQLSDQAQMGARETFNAIDVAAAEGRITPKQAESRKSAARAVRDAALSSIEGARSAEISAALSSGTNSLRMFAGGSVPSTRSTGRQGLISGNGSRDNVSTMLAPGEFVIRRSMVEKYGAPFLNDINTGSYPVPRSSNIIEDRIKRMKRPNGVFSSAMSPISGNRSMPNLGVMNKAPAMPKYDFIKGFSGASTVINEGSGKYKNNINAPVYNNNYSVSVNVSGSNASADEIANRTMMKIRNMQSMGIRSSRG